MGDTMPWAWSMVAVPGLVVGLACVAGALHAAGRGRDPRLHPWSFLVLVALGGLAVLGWAIRPLLTVPSAAYGLGVALLAWETILHGALLGLVSRLDAPAARWLRSRAGAGSLTTLVLGVALVVVLEPKLFIGRVGPLDGVPGLYRLDAGPGGAVWALVMVAIRVLALWVALGALGRSAGTARLRGLTGLVWSLVVFLMLFLLWLSNPVVIHVTGSAYLPGPVRFALPLVWTAVLAVGVWWHGAGAEVWGRPGGAAPRDAAARRT